MKNDINNKNNKSKTEFLVGLTPGSDGDLLHLSEGANGEIGYNILSFATEGYNEGNNEAGE